MSPEKGLAVLAEATEKVQHVKSDVVTALCRCPDLPQQGPAAADEALQCFERAEQHIQRLLTLAPQLQQLHEAVLQQQPGSGTQHRQAGAAASKETWTENIQQQARQASLALQQQVQAALCSSTGSAAAAAPAAAGLRHLQAPKQQRQYMYAAGHLPLLRVMESVAAAAPQLQLYLFKSATNQRMFCHYGGMRRPIDEDKLAKNWSWADEARVVCPGVFAASIALAEPGSVEPVRVCVDSADKAVSIDAWASSKHQVFKRISNLSVRALQHFQQLEAAQALLEPAADAAAAAAGTGQPHGNSSSSRPSDGVTLECLLLWLACYDDLFSRPCDVSGTLMAWEPATAIPLPPVLRPYWLSHEQLVEAARSSGQRKAYHAHLAPWPAAEQQAAAAAGAAAAQQQELVFGNGAGIAAAPADDVLLAQLQDVMAQ